MRKDRIPIFDRTTLIFANNDGHTNYTEKDKTPMLLGTVLWHKSLYIKLP
jgi:hypothetical protein